MTKAKDRDGINLTCYTAVKAIDLTNCKIVKAKQDEALITAVGVNVSFGGTASVKIDKKQFDEIMKAVKAGIKKKEVKLSGDCGFGGDNCGNCKGGLTW